MCWLDWMSVKNCGQHKVVRGRGKVEKPDQQFTSTHVKIDSWCVLYGHVWLQWSRAVTHPDHNNVSAVMRDGC
jgi:hypothetical protein